MTDSNETQGNLHRISSETTPSKNGSCKHGISSPLGIKTKSLRHEEEEDVHSSSPVTPTENLDDSDNIYLASPCSPTSSFLSQEQPDIIWDYSSPKHLGGVPKKERNITIKDLTRALSLTKKAFQNNPHVVSPVSSSTSSHSKLVEKWMSKDYVVNIPPDPPPKAKKSLEKKASEESFVEMLKILESFASTGFRSKVSNKAKPEEKTSTAEENLQSIDAVAQESNSSDSFAENKPVLKASVDKENDSSDELWGDDLANESFIIEASQFSVNLDDEMSDFSMAVATPEMVPVVTNGSFVPKVMLYQKNSNIKESDKSITSFEGIGAELSKSDVFDRTEKMCQKNLFPKKSGLSSKPCVQVSSIAHSPLPKSPLFSSSSCSFRGEESHIGITVDYAEGCPTENMCDQLPFSESSAKNDKEKNYTFSKRMNFGSVLSKNKQSYNFCDSFSQPSGLGMSSSQGAGADSLRREPSFQGRMCNNSKNCVQNSTLTVQHNCDTSTTKAAADNADSVFEAFDDPLVLEPDTWSWINEVESQASSQVKCSPEEIALKKAAALKRRQQKQLLKKAKK